jgi:hypothetical protein
VRSTCTEVMVRTRRFFGGFGRLTGAIGRLLERGDQ